MDAPDHSFDRWLVACLCADWCHVCQDYRQTFAQLAREFAGAAGFVWVDIEDDEDALGTVEVDDFPTLLIARAGEICHFAAVMPNAPTGQRLVRRALAGELAPLGDAYLAGLPERLHALRRARGKPEIDDGQFRLTVDVQISVGDTNAA
jgi:thiol-disulfide isomerase/thioredoxin